MSTYCPSFGTGLVQIGSIEVQAGSSLTCPADASLTADHSSCECDEDFAPDITKSKCVKKKDRGSNSSNICPAYGWPISPLTGTKRLSETLGTWLGQSVQVVYDTRRKLPSNDATMGYTSKSSPSFGGLWESSLHKKLVLQSGGRQVVQAMRGSNVWFSFVDDGAGHFTAAPEVADRLEVVGTGWRYTDVGARSQETYDATGVLKTVAYANGTVLTYGYSDTTTPVAVAPAAGLLIQVQDQLGRRVQFQYEQPADIGQFPRILGITDPAGQAIGIGYDTAGNLARITWADGKVRQFVYENPALPWAVGGVVDENNARFTTYGYDAEGRAVETQAAGGVDHFKATYGTPPVRQVTDTYDAALNIVWRDHRWVPPQNTVVTLSTGQTTTLEVQSVQGQNRLTSSSQPAGSGCLLATSRQGFDSANGNLAWQDDFNQHRTCYAYDGGNRETTRVEGLANTATCGTVIAANAALPAGSRKTSTAWHPDWRLQAKVAEPGRITTFVYNGQRDPFNQDIPASCAPTTAKLPDDKPIAVLCRRIEQATTDVNGSKGFAATVDTGVANRVTSWTYNEFGQVWTEDGPREDISDITTYVYYTDTTVDYTLGDLKQVTSATGEVSMFTKYNKHGQVLESTDGNRVLTVNTYDFRQRLRTSTVLGLKTTYDYDAVGQLKKITRPDAGWIGFDYDDAHRQKAVYDHLKNRIEYTLDNEGRRRIEDVKDPGGVLRRQLKRDIDALGRVQQTTGRQ